MTRKWFGLQRFGPMSSDKAMVWPMISDKAMVWPMSSDKAMVWPMCSDKAINRSHLLTIAVRITEERVGTV